MEDFLISCVARYQELTGVTKMRRASTPFLAEPSKPELSAAAGAPEVEPDPDAALAELQSYLDRVECEKKVAMAARLRAADPNVSQAELDEAWDIYEEDPHVPEVLASYAAKALMKVLYAARYARFDLLRAVCALAQQVSKWTRECDLKLYRLMCFIQGSLKVRMTGWIGDPVSALGVHLFADADFAGCPKTSRSTSGMHLSVMGPSSVWPVAGQSKKQTCVSHSTPEAEIVSADHAVRMHGVPALSLFERLLGLPQDKLVIQFHEDNATAVQVLKTGYSAAMRHIERTHGVCLRFLAERFTSPAFHVFYERSVLMSADVYTKHFVCAAEWELVTKLINHLVPSQFWPGEAGGYKPKMPAEHKGDVKFSYWCSNPWDANKDRRIAEYVNAAGIPDAVPDIDTIKPGSPAPPSSLDFAILAAGSGECAAVKNIADCCRVADVLNVNPKSFRPPRGPHRRRAHRSMC